MLFSIFQDDICGLTGRCVRWCKHHSWPCTGHENVQETQTEQSAPPTYDNQNNPVHEDPGDQEPIQSLSWPAEEQRREKWEPITTAEHCSTPAQYTGGSNQRPTRTRRRLDPNRMTSGTLEMQNLMEQIADDSSSSESEASSPTVNKPETTADTYPALMQNAEHSTFGLCMVITTTEDLPKSWKQAVHACTPLEGSHSERNPGTGSKRCLGAGRQNNQYEGSPRSVELSYEAGRERRYNEIQGPVVRQWVQG